MVRLLSFFPLVVLFGSCSFMTISRAPQAEGHRYARRTVRDDDKLRLLGDHRCISWQGWEGDTVAAVAEAVYRTVLIGPPLLPFVPMSTGYGRGGDGVHGGEVSSPDRLWVSLLLTIAPGHSMAIDPCAAEWSGGGDTLQCAGMVRTDGTMAASAFIPLAYRCDAPLGPMSWTNRGMLPEQVFLMLRFQNGIRLEGGAEWTLRLPCVVNGTVRVPVFHFRHGQWSRYIPIALVNG